MKELSIEEKAKAYDEAKLRMSAAYNNNRCTIGFMNEIFPELKESEDERIRMQLLNWFKGCHWNAIDDGTLKRDDIITWIEKQGEQKPIEEYNITGIKSKYAQGKLGEMIKRKLEIEKQGEQKPVDKIKPKFKIKYAGNEYNIFKIKDIAGVTYYGIEDEPNHIDYVLSDNCEIVSEQKFYWKPSDEQMDAIDYVKNFDYGGYKDILVSLYYDLKKLREE